jgi:hypothetical protein
LLNCLLLLFRLAFASLFESPRSSSFSTTSFHSLGLVGKLKSLGLGLLRLWAGCGSAAELLSFSFAMSGVSRNEVLVDSVCGLSVW